ncbi:hypothetical protein SCOR_29690 [Sulfidibacter corallicola]
MSPFERYIQRMYLLGTTNLLASGDSKRVSFKRESLSRPTVAFGHSFQVR